MFRLYNDCEYEADFETLEEVSAYLRERFDDAVADEKRWYQHFSHEIVGTEIEDSIRAWIDDSYELAEIIPMVEY